MALSLKRLDKVPARVWVLLGDSEMAEGSVWEAFELGGHYGLDNLTAILDMNRLGQRGPTMLEWHGEVYAERARNGRARFQWRMLDVSHLIGLPKRLARLRHFLCKWIRWDATIDVLL